MKKVFKKTLAMLLAVIMLFGAAPLSGFVGLELPEFNLFNMNASAATYSGTCGDNLTWTLDTDTGELVISGTGEMADWWIESSWYEYKDTIIKVNINDGVTSIGDFAFYTCINLKDVTIPDSVTSIGSNAFSDCTALTSVTIPDSVTSIGSDAFRNCTGITNITIPEDVINIGSYAFYDCTGLKSIVVDKNNKYYSSDEYGVLFNKAKTTLIKYPLGNTRTNYTIPETVMSISSSAFRCCISLKSIIIPDSVMSVGDYAFYGCNLEKVRISDSVTTIGEGMFMNCRRLSIVMIPDSITSIEESAFWYCDLSDVYYAGTEEEWNEIEIGESNEDLSYAIFHFNYVPEENEFNSFEFSQVHTVSNYQTKNQNYTKTYFDGTVNALDGANGTPDMCIPGLSKDDDMVPQGITYYKDKNWVLISAYSSKGCKTPNRPSVIYALDFDTGEYVAEFKIYNSDLTPHTEHVGGIAASEYCLYLADSGSRISYIPLEKLDVEKGTAKSLIIEDSYDVGLYLNNAPVSYLSYSEGYLYAGNFYHTEDGYDKPASDTHNSLLLCFNIPAEASYHSTEWDWIGDPNNGINKTDNICSPRYIYKIPNSISKIQGVATSWKKNAIILISSYGRTNTSTIYTVDEGSLTNIAEGLGVTEITEPNITSYTGLPMLEGAFIRGDYIYTVTESASYYYNGYNSGYQSKDPTDVVWKFKYNDFFNLGAETYRFKNFSDSDSKGHCFGMSMTSSAYHIGELDISNAGGSNGQYLYTLTLNSAVKTPICYYQARQGSYSVKATVAGGSYYKYQYYDIKSDWKDVVNYVKNHSYDGKGSLQIGFRKNGEGGHAINFLRYEEVNGQARIYAYDNNFPDVETYFYQDANGDIRQAPRQTFSGPIDCIALRSVSIYFNAVDNYDATRYIYADRDAISVVGTTVYPIDGDVEMGERVMFEIPADVEQVTITPLVDNAEFTYLDKEYSFGDVDDDTVGILKLASTDEGSAGNPEMTIVSKSGTTSVSIRTPSTTTISYGDSIVLHAETESTLPNGYYIEWTADNGNFSYTAAEDGTCTISPESSGETTFTAAVVDAEGNVISSDTQEMTSKAGFFQKIIAFFKMLFGLTKVIPQMFMGIY